MASKRGITSQIDSTLPRVSPLPYFLFYVRVSLGPSTAISHEIYTHPAGCAHHGKSKPEGKGEVDVDVVCLLSLLELQLKLRDVVLFPLWEEKEAPASLFLFQLRLHRLQLNTIISQKQRRRPAAPANLYTHSSCSEKHLERCCIRQPADPYPRVNEWYAMPAPSAN
ncbi:hypothetical protein TESG_07114 [Trichophyton tonsurans CBS 112818]|uniref:Uncharacterized protein n=1 Tax=Trichophyton tonsurans (strain CBS 112818) TaxID=647933 RepID=F2S877_TRIT1|nr:hypothetical protein TESG_07114 [Trichophyton tonsurans CBS 112818]